MKCRTCDAPVLTESGILCNSCHAAWLLSETGAKHDSGKVRPSLILDGFPRAILAVSEVGGHGLTMHPEGSWRHVPDGIKRFRDAKDRHRLMGAIEERDADSGLLHAAHEAWNALCVLELMLAPKEETGKN